MSNERNNEETAPPTGREKLHAFWHRVWPIARQVVGWLLIAFGILGLFLPLLQGVLFLVIGIALVGRHNWLLRWVTVHLKLWLRRWAAHPHPWLNRLGTLALRAQHQLSRQRRRLAWRWMERRSTQSSRGGFGPRHLTLLVVCCVLLALGALALLFIGDPRRLRP